MNRNSWTISTYKGADDDPEPQRHPCPDFFDTCCALKSDQIVKEVVKPKVEKHDLCGIRNKKGAAFTLIERENEAQFGKLGGKIEMILRPDFFGNFFVVIY